MEDKSHEYSEEYMRGFGAAREMAELIVQRARQGEIDQDFRSIAFRIRSMGPDSRED